MSVRKRTWKTRADEYREAWVVSYTDQAGVRRIATFERKKEADAYETEVRTQLHAGIHTPPSESPTVAEAAETWLSWCASEGREPATLEKYRTHLTYHIGPRIGGERIATLTTPRIQEVRDQLLRDLSKALARKVLISIKAILKDAVRRGNVAQNVALPVSIRMSSCDRHKLVVGVDIPTPEEIQRLVQGCRSPSAAAAGGPGILRLTCERGARAALD
jgi:integrase